MIETPRSPEWTWYVAGVQLYAALIVTRTPFAQANYGDGEWACILGHRGGNVNGEVYEPELRDALRKTLEDPVGQWCGWNPASLEEEASAWCAEHGIDVPWVWKDTLSAANVNGALGPFFRACRTRDVTVVGPEHLSAIGDRVVGPFRHVIVPDSTAWETVEEVVARLRWEASGLVLCAAGMGTNLIVDRLWRERRARRCMNPRPVTVLDVGAILDPYAGVYSRKGYRTRAFQDDAIARNLA